MPPIEEETKWHTRCSIRRRNKLKGKTCQSKSKETAQTEQVEEGQFSEKHFTHVLSSGEVAYDDYTKKDVEEFQELDFTDEQLQEAVSKLDKREYKQYVALRDQYLQQYRVTGRIKTFSDLVRESLEVRFPGIPGLDAKAVLELRDQLEFKFKQKKKEGGVLKDKGETISEGTEVEVPAKHAKKELGVEKLMPFLAQTVKECINLSVEPDESLLIKVMPNVPLHQAVTDDEMDLHAYFGEDDDSEYSLLSEEEDLFTPAAAKDLLYTLAEQKKQQAKLQAEAAKLLDKGGLPQETAEEMFKQALGFKRRSTTISEQLYDQCTIQIEFHLILCLGVRVLEEAKAWRLRKELKPKKGEFKELNHRTFKELSHQFNLAPTTVNRNYNEAIKYHKLRKLKKSKKSGEKEDQEEKMVEMSGTLTPEDLSEIGSDKDHPPEQEMDIVKLAGEAPKVPLVLKQEQSKQEPLPEGELQ